MFFFLHKHDYYGKKNALFEKGALFLAIVPQGHRFANFFPVSDWIEEVPE